MSATRILQGHYVQDGGIYEAGRLVLLLNEDGTFSDDCGNPVRAEEFRVTKDITDIEITSPDALWRFVPSGGECDRIGLAATKLNS